jgi:hypothetical protein
MSDGPAALPLIHTKLQRPRLRESHIPRSRLLESLCRAPNRMLILVSAPASYPTTALGQWLEGRNLYWPTPKYKPNSRKPERRDPNGRPSNTQWAEHNQAVVLVWYQTGAHVPSSQPKTERRTKWH